jgi:acyl-CoA thioester hydrolase
MSNNQIRRAGNEDEDFWFEAEVPVRFRDIDVGGHAHHSQILIYMEEARWAYWEQVRGRRSVEEVDYILAEVRVRYRNRVLYPDSLRVRMRTTFIGRKHFELEYHLHSGAGDILASGWTTQVMYDYEAGRSIPLSDDLRDRIEAFEGRPLPVRRSGT